MCVGGGWHSPAVLGEGPGFLPGDEAELMSRGVVMVLLLSSQLRAASGLHVQLNAEQVSRALPGTGTEGRALHTPGSRGLRTAWRSAGQRLRNEALPRPSTTLVFQGPGGGREPG